jgi:hemerythrin-like domain-containing protein
MPPTKRATNSATKATKKSGAAKKKATKKVTVKRSAAPPDAITLLKRDHQDVERLFKRFEQAGDRAHRRKRQLVDSMIEELSRHASIEETVFYPAVRAGVDDAESNVLEALEEHHVVKVVLRELEDMDPESERFDAKVTVMIENVRHHVDEEEGELFPEVRHALGRSRLRDLGDDLRAAKRGAPGRPHPAGPDEPPGNVLVEGAVAAVDRARTAGKEAVERVLA